MRCKVFLQSVVGMEKFFHPSGRIAAGQSRTVYVFCAEITVYCRLFKLSPPAAGTEFA
jgi:hypothetical protein